MLVRALPAAQVCSQLLWLRSYWFYFILFYFDGSKEGLYVQHRPHALAPLLMRKEDPLPLPEAPKPQHSPRNLFCSPPVSIWILSLLLLDLPDYQNLTCCIVSPCWCAVHSEPRAGEQINQSVAPSHVCW